MDSDAVPVPAPAPPATGQSGGRWRRFATKRILFASLALHLLLAGGAASWVVHRASPTQDKSRTFIGQPPGSQAATRAVEHRVKMASQRSATSAPPALRRVLSQRPDSVALPATPAMPDTPPMAPTLIGDSGRGAGAGFGFARPVSISGGATTQFIGGLRITARKLGVALDVSGSVRDYQQAMHAHVANVFKGSEVTEFTSAGFYAVQSPRLSAGSVILDFLNSPQDFDAIYIFSDFGETHDKIPAGHQDLWPEVRRLIQAKKTRLYLHILRGPSKEGSINPALAAVIQFARSTGGSVKVGPMMPLAADTAAADPTKPL